MSSERDDIYQDATMNQMLTPEDFQREFGRPRTEKEQQEYEMFNDAAKLAEPSTRMVWEDPPPPEE